ncbi:uncharacterized membrane protein YjjP (DUF1212 family) [Rhodoblastus acidophilus]|uniref:threonine/serine exporter family protein n=1 Tax=Rhodoblastus acidophilus TaxID=1074 RepID=UPI002224677F|nr:threonine/serine exporter family protein [Rhodoblastus acidophilus]MCW2286459.1 uncharacterized membrane protein YjjP (DUF1212 family) [Rhodoblastus acidophilus]MCW2335308.1 uncharacterized membrane protein YjjP (DUF1212 family) [Rhodoblastus acidophilus]
MDQMCRIGLSRLELIEIADVALKIGRVLMECGASVRVIQEGATLTARGLGVDEAGMRVGYASLAITVRSGDNVVTQMTPVGRHGVNHRLDMATRRLARMAGDVFADAGALGAELDRIVQETPRHAPWFVAVGVGVACASFSRLLGADWAAFPAVFVAAATAQSLRHRWLRQGGNPFVVAALAGFLAAFTATMAARIAGSARVDIAMMAATLLLVPGVPATNAQTDIMDGFPTVGSARAVSVAMVMMFSATGIWCAENLARSLS